MSLSNQVEKLKCLTTTLHGLSFGEHDGGAQRIAISEQLAALLHEFASGLLKADHSELVDPFLEALLSLLTSSITPLIVWTSFPKGNVQNLVQNLASRAADCLNTLPDQFDVPEKKPVQFAILLLQAVYALLQTGEATVSRDIAADILYTLLRVDDWADHAALFDSLYQHLGSVFRRSERHELHRLAFYPSLHERLSRSVNQEIDLSDPIASSGVHNIVQSADVLLELVSKLTISIQNPDISGLEAYALRLLKLACRLCDHVKQDTRDPALQCVFDLVPLLPKNTLLEEKRLLDVVVSSMLWATPETTVIAVPLIEKLIQLRFPVPSLKDTIPDGWRDARKMVLTTLERHITKRENREPSRVDIDAAVACVRAVPKMFGQTLLSSEWMLSLAELLRLVAVMRSFKQVIEVCSAITETLKHVWLNPVAFRRQLVDACVVSLGQSRRCDERETVCIAIQQVLITLTRCANSGATIDILRDLRDTADRFKGLADFASFLNEVLTIADGEDRISLETGPLVTKFFPDLVS